ncbi:TIGR02679 family protein [Siminovitchia fortis]|uniref:TIGR02679 family protein n=1 Tax=Siminovitchia fortis TaxID=254758 RepID=UPI00119F995E|nr:TIGR02679 family protein [Siminovitchia fortis]
MSLMDELIEYVRSEPGLDRLLRALLERYIQLGRIGGSVKLANLTSEEKESLSLFFRKDYSRQASASISFAAFEKALLKTKFAEIDIQALLNAYAGKKVYTRNEAEELYQLQKYHFFRELQQVHPQYGSWIEYVRKKGRGTRAIHQLYDENPEYLRKLIHIVCDALSQLPAAPKYERLPFFAQKITQNPHAFDMDQHGGRILLHALQFLLWERGEIPYIRGRLNAEEANDLLQNFQLLRDDLLNFVTFTGLTGETVSGEHPVLKAANEVKAVLNFPLREAAKLRSCRPVKGNAVFIVENSGVCSELLDRWPFPSPPPLISTNGQFKLASLLLIDLLTAGNTFIYYSGDFDPEGLLMANRLLNRCPSKIKLWRYSVEDYRSCRAKVDISKKRLAKLDKLESNELLCLKKEIISAKKAGYQEELVPLLLKDMKKQLL